MSNKNISNSVPSDNSLISFGFPVPYSGKAPSEARPANSEEEAQRIKAIEIIRRNAVNIKEAAKEFNVTPEAIAGAILWEACENPQPPWRNSGIPGKMHDYEALNIYNENSKIPRGWTPTRENLRVPQIAIVYIAAQMEYHSNVYRKVAKVDISSNSDYKRLEFHQIVTIFRWPSRKLSKTFLLSQITKKQIFLKRKDSTAK